MTLTRTPMSPEEATVLAAQIDQSHIPYSVKRVVQDGPSATLEIRDDTTGYLLFIHNAEHWRTFVAHSGNAGAIDMFCEASINVLAYLDEQLNTAKEERDRYMALAEQADTKAQGLQAQRDTVERAMAVVNGLDFVPHAPPLHTRKRKPAVPPRKLPDGTSQADWLRTQLKDGQAKHVGALAKELSPLIGMDERKLIQNLSSQLTDMIKRGLVRRIDRGWYEIVHPETTQESN
jgi:hypothetical protein